MIHQTIEGRLSFITDVTPPAITITAPTATTYLHSDSLTLDFSATDDLAGVKKIEALLDGKIFTNGQVIDLLTLALGEQTLTVSAVDKAGNASSQSVMFSITATTESLKATLDRLYKDGSINNKGIYKGLAEGRFFSFI